MLQYIEILVQNRVFARMPTTCGVRTVRLQMTKDRYSQFQQDTLCANHARFRYRLGFAHKQPTPVIPPTAHQNRYF